MKCTSRDDEGLRCSSEATRFLTAPHYTGDLYACCDKHAAEAREHGYHGDDDESEGAT
jgi:hypothetical protein